MVDFLGIKVGDAEERQELPTSADSAHQHPVTLPVVEQSPENGEILFSIAHPANVCSAMPSISSSDGEIAGDGRR